MSEMPDITVFAANCRGNEENCSYPHEIQISNIDTAKKAFTRDTVFAAYKNNYRSIDNFLHSNALPMDCDNDHSDDPKDWVSPEDIALLFAGVPHIIHYSRHHMKQKEDKSPRPRFHVIFLIDVASDADAYAAMKEKVQNIYPFFDTGAMDAARFFFGTENPEVIIQPGSITLDEFLLEYENEQAFAELDNDTIPEGRRNNTMTRIAARIIKRYGDTNEANTMFLAAAEKCTPPLEDKELNTIWSSAEKLYSKIKSTPGYIPPEAYNGNSPIQWDEPIPFSDYTLPEFPVNALPEPVRNYVLAVAEMTQTPVDMAGASSLAVMALCVQGNYRVRGKEDWSEPTNLFEVIIAEPSERKSAIVHFMTAPINAYEAEYNRRNAAALETNKMSKRVLEKRQRSIEDQVAKGKEESSKLSAVAEEVAGFQELMPLRLYVDDVTTEKLTSVLAECGGKAAIVSAEGGIFDVLSGMYTKNVNIDVLLKGHAGDSIRVDRIGRNSETIANPALTILLTVQPSVLSGLVQNSTFRGRGLTARFLYSMPTSFVGKRKYRTAAIPQSVTDAYERLISSLLAEEPTEPPEEITLSAEADKLLEAFAIELEPKLKEELAEISDWAGKLTGAVLRISGILCRAKALRSCDFLEVPDPLIVDDETMENAITIGRYFLEHAKAAYSLMGADPVVKHCQYLLNTIRNYSLSEFTRRDVMRACRTFRTAEEVQPVLDRLMEYGYIAPKGALPYGGTGRPAVQTYLVNPSVLSD